VARPNSTETPNIPATPNESTAQTAVEPILEHYERLMQRLLAGHAPEFAGLDITMTQAKVLYVVSAAGRLRMSELAARLGIGTSSASELVDRLVELELLERGEDARDRRHVVISPTSKAHDLLERFRELNQRQLRGLLGRLDPHELACVDESIAILDRAIDRLTADANPNQTAQQTHSRENRS
jgi:DNA-binding MarR family transcriptional regulator